MPDSDTSRSIGAAEFWKGLAIILGIIVVYALLSSAGVIPDSGCFETRDGRLLCD